MSVLLFIFDKTGKLLFSHLFSSSVSDEKLNQSLAGLFSILLTNTNINLGNSNQIKSIVFTNYVFSIFESDNGKFYAVIKHSIEIDQQLMEFLAKEVLKQDGFSMKSKISQVFRNPISTWIDSQIVILSKQFQFNYIYIFWSKDRYTADNIAFYPKHADYTKYSEVKDGVFKSLFRFEDLMKERRSEFLLEFDIFVGIFFFTECVTIYTEFKKELYTNENYNTITAFVHKIKSVNVLLKGM